jgi:carboxymethylenebutenolidase
VPTIDLDSPLGSSSLRAYLARPAANEPRPGVVVLHEAFGLDDVMRRNADRLAAGGYLTLAPDLFSDGGPRRCLAGTLRSLSTGKGNAYADIEASRQWLLDNAECTGKVGVIGFCLGGGFALVTAPSGFDVSSANYGMVPRHADQALAGACPIVASYGKWDGMVGMPARLERALTSLGIEHDIKTYPNAGHSFLNDAPTGPAPLRPLMKVMRIGPEPTAAADAWRRIEAFFAEHLAS